MSMDDTTYVPDDPSLYTLEFGTNGNASMRIDCNRGTGSWTSESNGELHFGPIAATRAMCPPGSLHDTYLAQFEWVRSYTMRDGHLFLATMADGSIIEFEPLVEPVAVVLGQEIRTADAAEMQETILRQLFGQYASEKGLEVSDEEIDLFNNNLVQGMAAEGLTAADQENLSAEETAQLAAMRQDMARNVIQQWKLNQALYEQYGGRIIFQQFGPEPLDAYRIFLEEKQSDGAFSIMDAEMEKGFWRYFTDESLHSFYEPGSEAEAKSLETPPWEQL
jgi:heat shock protein HslJ